MAELAQLFDWRLRSFLDRARIDCDKLFDFNCPKQWGELTPGSDPFIRHCTECNRNVHLAVDEQQLRELARQKMCVAVVRPEEMPSPDQVPQEEREPIMMVGLISSEF